MKIQFLIEINFHRYVHVETDLQVKDCVIFLENITFRA